MEKSSFINKLSILRKKNIALIGHMGSGKSVLGKKIARELDLEHIDTDQKIIEFENKTINKIFELKGENYFRELEAQIILKLLEKKNIIISLGGGSITNKQIRNKLMSNSVTVFLDVSLEKLEIRLSRSKNRPLLKNIDILSKLKELDTQRRKYYLDSNIKIQNANSINKTYLDFIEYFSNINDQNNQT